MLGRLRTYFLTGLVVTAPIAITIWLVWWFVSLVDGWIKPFIPNIYNPDNYLPFPVPGVGLVAALIAMTIVGALAANLVGRTLINFGERTLDRMPVIRSVYKGVKQIFETALSSGSGNFSSVAALISTSMRLLSRATIVADVRLPEGNVTRIDDGLLTKLNALERI